MKNLLFAMILFSALALTPGSVMSQAWEKNTKVLSLGIGTARFYHVGDHYYYNSNGDDWKKNRNRGWYSPVTGQLNIRAEFGIHDYIGIGLATGIGGRGGWSNNYKGEVNIPIGIHANFHFYQLIADNADKEIHADKLDIYAGLNLGTGVALTYYRDNDWDTNTRRVVPLAYGGLHAGARYYFTPKVGVNAELGWGQNLINLGFVFKM